MLGLDPYTRCAAADRDKRLRCLSDTQEGQAVAPEALRRHRLQPSRRCYVLLTDVTPDGSQQAEGMDSEPQHHAEQRLVEGGFLIPCVLLLLEAQARHADELRALVEAFGFQRQARGLPWMLRRLEADGLIASVRQPDGHGGTRHHLQLASEGHRWLSARAESLAEPARLVARFLARYEAEPGAGDLHQASTPPFTVERSRGAR